MATPTKTEILEKAEELFHRDNQQFITPEEQELKESGYYTEAQHQLMQGENAEAISFIEQQANELGFRLIPEKQHSDILYYQLKLEKLRKIVKQQRNHVKPIQQSQPKKPIAKPETTETLKTIIETKPSICTSIKAKLENFATILKLIGEICHLKLQKF